MAFQAWIHDMACAMLSLKELSLDLRNYLDEIEMYANLAGGSVQSRQIVAMALVNYMDRQAFLKQIEDLEKRLDLDEE